MDPRFEVPGQQAHWDESLFAWLLHMLGLKPSRTEEFANLLVGAFHLGMPVENPPGGPWFATLDAVNPEDDQVAVLVRLSRHRLEKPKEVRRGMVDVEQRNRTLFAEPFSAGPGEEEDLLLTYSFPVALGLDQNMELFREFAGNELHRLRSKQAR